MENRLIYRVGVSYTPSVGLIYEPIEEVTYFSNLKKTVDALQQALLLQGWDKQPLNYTAVYRSMQVKGKFVAEFQVKRVKYFRITIEVFPVNPALPALGIPKHPGG